jgi:hypothetical protein
MTAESWIRLFYATEAGPVWVGDAVVDGTLACCEEGDGVDDLGVAEQVCHHVETARLD